MQKKILSFISIILLFIIILPIVLQSGYFFSLDQSLNANGWIPRVGSNIYTIGLLSQIFIYFDIPIYILEKILIAIAFILPAVGGYLLLDSSLVSKDCLNIKARTKLLVKDILMLYGITFLFINPFIYGRLLDGQINIYLTYSLYPLFFYFLKISLEDFKLKNILLLSLLSLLLITLSLHNIVFLFFIFLIFGIIYVLHSFRIAFLKKIFKVYFIVFLVTLFYLIPLYFSRDTNILSQVNNFGINHYDAFVTLKGEVNNLYINILSLRGYWGEGEGRFESSYYFLSNFLIILILILNILGVYFLVFSKFLKKEKRKILGFSTSLLALGILSYILAFGISDKNIFYGLSLFLYNNFPYYSGFREPQKWVIFLVISYSYFGTFGLYYLSILLSRLNLNRFILNILLIILISIPVLYTYKELFIFKQMSINNYPKEWTEIKNYLKDQNIVKLELFKEKVFKDLKEVDKKSKNKKSYKTLIFPWHGYINLSFIGKTTLMSSSSYFGNKDNKILFGDNIEIGNIYSQSNRIESQIIESYIGIQGDFKLNNLEENYNKESYSKIRINKKAYTNFIQDLKLIGIKNIILLKEEDYEIYLIPLKKLQDLNLIEKIKENNLVILYTILD